jgi:hypothetical protein
MHPSLEQLLALRDGEGPPDAAAHLDNCPACTAELARLRAVRDALRSLPSVSPPEAAWPRIRKAHARRRRPARWRAAAALGLAASVVLAVTLAVRPPVEVPRAALPAVPHDAGSRPELQVALGAAPMSNPALADLHAQSRNLDALLAEVDASDRVLDLGTAGAIVALEDRIAALDRRLTNAALDGPVAAALWRQRVELMEALVGVHVAHVEPVYFDSTY